MKGKEPRAVKMEKGKTPDHASTEIFTQMRVLGFELNSVIGSLIQTTKFQTSTKNLN